MSLCATKALFELPEGKLPDTREIERKQLIKGLNDRWKLKPAKQKLREYLHAMYLFHYARLTSESERNQQLLNQLNVVHQTLSQRDSELKDATLAMNGPLGDLDRLSRDHDVVARESDTHKKRY